MVRCLTKIAPKIALQKKFSALCIAKTYFFWAQFCTKLHSKLRYLGCREVFNANQSEDEMSEQK
jgi:hypothetical protein